jgi:hypothetical protein
MSKRRFEMYQYRQIIVRLRSGDSLRGIGRTKLADRKTVRRVHAIAKQQVGWIVIMKFQVMRCWLNFWDKLNY